MDMAVQRTLQDATVIDPSVPKTVKVVGRDVNVYYGDKHALKHVNVDIPDKGVMAFIGPSGCGKSTFLRCINRMNDTIPSCRVTGKIMIDGEDIYRPEPRCRSAARTGRHGVPEAKSLPQVGVREHCLRTAHSWPGDDPRPTSTRLWSQASSAPGFSKKSKTACTMRARDCRAASSSVCASRAPLRCEPDIILMDEPCSALDPIATARIEELMEELTRQLHHRDRHALHAAGGARLAAHRLLSSRHIWSRKARRR